MSEFTRMSSLAVSSLHRTVKALVAPLPEGGIARNNALSAFFMGALPAIGGSVIAVMLYTFFVWALVSLAFGRFEFRMTRNDRFLAWTFTAFAGLIVATALMGKNPWEAPRSLAWLLAFLSPWALIPRLRASPQVNYLGFYIAGAALGAIGAGVMVVVQTLVFGSRPEGGAGNADVFAIMSLCLMCLGGLNIASSSDKGRMLGVVAAAVVTRDVPAYALMVGVPARRIGWVSRAGEILDDSLTCPRTGERYELEGETLRPIA